MSGSSRRSHSKWDHRDSEEFSENLFEKDPPRKIREPHSPNRGSHRHKSHRSERSDREDGNIRRSPDLDEWRYQHSSRSPRSGRGHSYRSRSRSRSRSPDYKYRQEPALAERNRAKSGGSTTICRDFIAGRCRKGTHCFFLHQEAEFNDSRRPLGKSPPDSRENKDRRIGNSRYSADDEYSVRGEKSGDICVDFVKGRCRKGSSCRLAHHEKPMTDDFEKRPADDVYRDRDNKRDYPDRDYDREIYRRAVPPCKFFAVGNCRNGNHCKFSHQVQEKFSGSRDDRRRSDRKLDCSPDEPRWNDAVRVSNVPTVHDRDEDEETRGVNSAKHRNDSWDHETWMGTDEPKSGDERRALRRKTENSGALIEMGNVSGDMETSPRDVSKQQSSSLYSETPSLSNVDFSAVQRDMTSETPRDDHHHYDFPGPKVSGDLHPEPNPNFVDKLDIHSEEEKNNVGSDRMSIAQNPPMNVPPVQGMFQNDPPINVRPTLSINLPPSGGDTLQLSSLSPSMNACGISPGDPRVKFRPTLGLNHPVGQGQTLRPFHSSGGNGTHTSHDHSPLFGHNNRPADRPPVDPSVTFQPMSNIKPSGAQVQLSLPSHSGGNGMQTSHNPMPFLNNKTSVGPHLDNSNVMQHVPNHSSVSSEQYAQLSVTLAQLIESQQQQQQQQLNLSSASNTSGISVLPDTTPSVPSVSDAKQPNQAPKLGNPIEDSNQESYKMSKNDENGPEMVDGGNKTSENVGVNDGDEDGKKSKDSKGLRSFKFALADYTKELLKPAWKDGKVNKESYKTIVKKVVDKVIETQGSQIPQTKEKIEQYLSCSKPKLEKLVQAYVGKYKT